jgi:hypothetical protein
VEFCGGSEKKKQQNGFAFLLHQVAGTGSATSKRGVVVMVGTGKFFVGGNWKCNGTQESIAKLVSHLNSTTLEDDVDIVVAPPAIYIQQVVKSLAPRIQVSAQNAWVSGGGAFTGEVSAEQLKDIGTKWLITGHSERRHILGNMKILSLLSPDEMCDTVSDPSLKDISMCACVPGWGRRKHCGQCDCSDLRHANITPDCGICIRLTQPLILQ